MIYDLTVLSVESQGTAWLSWILWLESREAHIKVSGESASRLVEFVG